MEPYSYLLVQGKVLLLSYTGNRDFNLDIVCKFVFVWLPIN